MGRPKGSKNKEQTMLAEKTAPMDEILEQELVKTEDQVLEAEDRQKVKPEDEIVEVQFFNLEDPGLKIKFSYGHANNVKNYELWHAGKYKLPRGLVRHLESRQTPIYEYKMTEAGKHKELIGYRQRFNLRQVW